MKTMTLRSLIVFGALLVSLAAPAGTLGEIVYVSRCYYVPVTAPGQAGPTYVQHCYWAPAEGPIDIAIEKDILVPGGAVGEPWGVVLGSVIKDGKEFTMISGPAWAAVDGEGVLQGTPAESDAGENVWTIGVTTGSGKETLTVRTHIGG